MISSIYNQKYGFRVGKHLPKLTQLLGMESWPLRLLNPHPAARPVTAPVSNTSNRTTTTPLAQLEK